MVHLLPGRELPVSAAATLDLPETPPTYATEIPVRLERQQLEGFLAANPGLIEPGLTLFGDEDGRAGQQHPTDVGVVDLLCRRPSGEILVVELKRSRVSDEVVGQISRYIGWIRRHLAAGAPVSGPILSHERDEGLEYAVLAHSNLALKYFKIRLELVTEEKL